MSCIRERLSWQQVIVLDGVKEIPEYTFFRCYNIKRVIFADTVIRIERSAFHLCQRLVFIKWSLHLQFIGQSAFDSCNLSSIFIPLSCRDIGSEAFAANKNLTILNVSQDADLGYYIIRSTELHKRSQFNHEDPFNNDESPQINTWLKNINQNDEFDLHRICSSFEPTLDMILNTMKEKGGPNAFKVRNSIGITPSQYLKENPYADVKEKDIIKKYVLQMTGEL